MIKKTETAQTRINREEQAKLNRLYYTILGEDGAVEIIQDLEGKFEKRSMVKHLADGSVDTAATMVQCGAYEFVSYIKQRIELGAKGE